MSLHQCSAAQIVTNLQAGTLSADEVCHVLRSRIQSLNSRLNAIVAVNPAPACEQGPLAGLPITVKDQIQVKDLPCTFGSPRFKTHVPTKTAPAVQRLLNAGAHVLAKTNLPPFAMDFQTSNGLFGTTNNPWNLAYTPGGSSGGGAAAVAAGLSFADIGADLGGSLRIPASFCGVFSLLPTQDALPGDGMLAGGAAPLRHFARIGPMTRSAADLALIWSHLSDAPSTDQAFDMPKVVYSLSGAVPELCSSIAACVQQAIATWQGQGVNLRQAWPKGFDARRARQTYGRIMGHETAGLLPAPLRLIARLTSRDAARRSPEFLRHVMQGYKRNRAGYAEAIEDRHNLSALLDDFLGEDRVWLLPVTATRVFRHMTPATDSGGVRDYVQPLQINGKPANYLDALTCYVTPTALTGHPVVTMPLRLDPDGLPIGAQLVGAKGQEARLIETARRLSALLPPLICPMLSEG